MDSSHKLEAPNNESLKSIEQIEDHSGLTTLYREPGEQFEGPILSAEERTKVKEAKLSSLTNGIWKSSFNIGFWLAYPIVSGAVLGAALYSTVTWANAGVLLGLVILSGMAWVLTSYSAYSAIFKTFYKHALQAGPFLLVMLTSVLLASQAFYGYVTANLAGQSLLFNISLTASLVLLYSLVASFVVLLVWGNPRLNSGLKILASGVVIIISGFLVALVYLL